MSAYDDDDGRGWLLGVLLFVALVLGGLVFRLSANEQQAPKQAQQKDEVEFIALGGENNIELKLGESAEAEVLAWGPIVAGLKQTRISLCVSKDPRCERVLVTKMEQLLAPGTKVRVRSLVTRGVPVLSGEPFYMVLAE